MSLPFPARLKDTIENRYGSDARKRCIRGAYNHKTEEFMGRKAQFTVKCADLPLPPAIVQPEIRPWASDLPEVTVEHLLDNNTRLSSVIFFNGNEIRRSYADGLNMNTNGTISYHIASKNATESVLVPFLLEERESYARNAAKRSAEELNTEVLPIIDIPEVGNNYFPLEADPSNQIRLRIGEWNAERGGNWNVLPNFIENPDILILNEMDWGMARSGNVHTIRQMARSLHMNYAYGVEL